MPIGVVHEGLENGDLVRRAQVGDILVGGRVGYLVAGPYVVEGGLAISPGQVARTNRTGTIDIPALGFYGSARVGRAVPLNSDFEGHFAAGIGVIRRSGGGWLRPRTEGAGSIAGGLQTRIGPKYRFRMELELLVSRGHGQESVAAPQRRTWRGDVLVSFGVVVPG